MVDQANAYNSWWQFRADSWSRLEEATARIVSSLRRSRPIEDDMTDAVHAACAALAPVEQFWAFPGHAAFGVVQELAAAGSWERLGRLVAGSTARWSRSPTGSVPSMTSCKPSIATIAKT